MIRGGFRETQPPLGLEWVERLENFGLGPLMVVFLAPVLVLLTCPLHKSIRFAFSLFPFSLVSCALLRLAGWAHCGWSCMRGNPSCHACVLHS